MPKMREAQTIFAFVGHCHCCDVFCRDGTAEANKHDKEKGGIVQIGC
jgi:hypothetical protein